MDHFHIIEDGACILRMKRGIYRQTKVYRRGRDVFAGFGSGFVRLMPRASTTHPDIGWLDLEAPGVTLSNTGHPRFEEAA